MADASQPALPLRPMGSTSCLVPLGGWRAPGRQSRRGLGGTEANGFVVAKAQPVAMKLGNSA
ncbi:MAG: hypothetical protein KDK41_14015 [Leptospiraceae bacterium]|nr:hypothetical protein [Leptospiraceae bacterium]